MSLKTRLAALAIYLIIISLPYPLPTIRYFYYKIIKI